MDLRKWSASNLDYGRKVLNSGLDGARSGREAFLNGRALAPFLSESLHDTWKSAAVGACIGLLGSHPGNRHKSVGRSLACGVLGGVIGFGAGVVWNNRRLTASVAHGALRNIGRVRDEHWLERHPIDYA